MIRSRATGACSASFNIVPPEKGDSMTRTTLALLIAAAAGPAQADAVADFYRGKTITMLVASGVGGGYDTYARTFARHATKFIPGAPNIVAKNMPAAGGLAAASTIYNNVDKDALTI